MEEDKMVGWQHWVSGHEFEKRWKIVEVREAGCVVIHGVAKSQTRLSN